MFSILGPCLSRPKSAASFDSDTPAGHRFDVALIWLILLSVVTVSLEKAEAPFEPTWGDWLYGVEWALTLVFTLEYILRIWSAERGRNYALSFFGIVDLVAILPTFLSLFFAGTQALIAIRIRDCCGCSECFVWWSSSAKASSSFAPSSPVLAKSVCHRIHSRLGHLSRL